MMASSKKSRELSYYFGIFERSYVYHIHAKFHNQGLTDSGFMTGEPFCLPQDINPSWLDLKCRHELSIQRGKKLELY